MSLPCSELPIFQHTSHNLWLLEQQLAIVGEMVANTIRRANSYIKIAITPEVLNSKAILPHWAFKVNSNRGPPVDSVAMQVPYLFRKQISIWKFCF
jgi:hypothetical protein